jgi:hypothetical protein
MTKKFIFPVLALMIALSFVGVISAQESKSTTLTGPIVDKACSASLPKKDDPAAFAAEHSGTKGCALKGPCAGSGFGVYADGKWTEFDAKGNELAKAALEKSSKEKGVTFKVAGKVSDGKMAVDSITEVN